MHEDKRVIPELDEQKSVEIIYNFIKSKLEESKSEGLVIGLSGGIDSSVVAYLCAKVVEIDKILGILIICCIIFFNLCDYYFVEISINDIISTSILSQI